MISGASITVERLAHGMAQRGHQVLVIAASDQGWTYPSMEGNLTVLRLRSMYNPFRVGQRFLLYPRSAVMNTLDEFKPDIIHAHEPSLCWIGFEYAERRNIPTTLTVHMLPWFAGAVVPNHLGLQKMAERTAWMYLRLLSRNTTLLIATTKTASTVIGRELGVRAETIPCEIDTDVFHPRPASDRGTALRKRLGLPSGIPIILHVGRLDLEKNVDRILQAAVPVLHQTNAHLLIVGDGRERPALMKLSRSLGIADRVHFPGYISTRDGLPDVYRMADLFVMASEVESQGLVLLEAAASGLPLVAFDTPTISEVVHDQVNGYLVKAGDVPALGRAMTRIIESPKMALAMGMESRTLSQRYDSQLVQSLHEQFYKRLIKRVKTHGRRKSSSWKRAKAWMEFSAGFFHKSRH